MNTAVTSEQEPRLKIRISVYSITLLIAYVLAVISFFPPVRALSIFNFIWPVLMVGWLFLSIIDCPHFFRKPDPHQLACYFFFAYTIAIPFVAGNGFIGNRFLEYLQLPVFYWIYKLNKYRGREKDNFKILLGLVPVAIATSILTITKYISQPNISRTAKKDTAAGLEQMSQGIAGYEFVYLIVFSLPLIIFYFRQSNHRLSGFSKAMVLTILGIFILNILKSNFMIALFLSFVSIIVGIFVSKISSVRVTLYFLIALVLIPLIPALGLFVIDLALSFFDSSMNAQRLLELKELLLYGLVEVSLGARLEAFQSSLIAFYNNPLVGIITSDIGGHGDGLTGFGQHSFLLDSFALFGLLVGSLGFYVFFQPIITRIRLKQQKTTTLPLLMLVLALIFCTVNNMAPAIGFVIYFAFPTILDKLNPNLR